MKKLTAIMAGAALAVALVGCETTGGMSMGVPGTGVSVGASGSAPAATTSTQKYDMPFSVTVAGQKAVANNAICALIPNAVSNDAEVVLGVKPQQVIINAFDSDLKGNCGGQAKAVIVGKDTNKVKLNATIDKKALAAGTYLMNIVAEGKTARVVFTVK